MSFPNFGFGFGGRLLCLLVPAVVLRERVAEEQLPPGGRGRVGPQRPLPAEQWRQHEHHHRAGRQEEGHQPDDAEYPDVVGALLRHVAETARPGHLLASDRAGDGHGAVRAAVGAAIPAALDGAVLPDGAAGVLVAHLSALLHCRLCGLCSVQLGLPHARARAPLPRLEGSRLGWCAVGDPLPGQHEEVLEVVAGALQPAACLADAEARLGGLLALVAPLPDLALRVRAAGRSAQVGRGAGILQLQADAQALPAVGYVLDDHTLARAVGVQHLGQASCGGSGPSERAAHGGADRRGGPSGKGGGGGERSGE
mmetsp:Transcript_102035/g.284858  ORF Transcript_102035/g.284858 Transcript_102035/m.284858 type:complete len:311 (+) Transcript_102035:149-1081(+)